MSFVDRARAAAQSAVRQLDKLDEQAYNKALKLYVPLLKEELEKAYVEAATAWYNAYTPKLYRRNYSIKNMFDVQWDGSTNNFGYTYLSERMTKGKNGYSLYEPVFIQGWHGGASAWGKTCVRTTPVIDLFNPEIERLTNKYNKIINEKADSLLVQLIEQANWWGWLNG